jgi:hypothetical protein
MLIWRTPSYRQKYRSFLSIFLAVILTDQTQSRGCITETDARAKQPSQNTAGKRQTFCLWFVDVFVVRYVVWVEKCLAHESSPLQAVYFIEVVFDPKILYENSTSRNSQDYSRSNSKHATLCDVRLEVLTAMEIRILVFWVVVPCSLSSG